jgi:hypothetical protein
MFWSYTKGFDDGCNTQIWWSKKNEGANFINNFDERDNNDMYILKDDRRLDFILLLFFLAKSNK